MHASVVQLWRCSAALSGFLQNGKHRQAQRVFRKWIFPSKGFVPEIGYTVISIRLPSGSSTMLS